MGGQAQGQWPSRRQAADFTAPRVLLGVCLALLVATTGGQHSWYEALAGGSGASGAAAGQGHDRGLRQVPAQQPPVYEEPGNQWDLMDCINENQNNYQATSMASAMSSRAASLRVVGLWWSKKKAEVPVTITTQMSASRLWQLKALCMTYPGPVSVALYLGMLKGRAMQDPGLLSKVIEQTGEFFHIMEEHGACKMDLMLMREMFVEKEARIWYPINQMRNYARLQARTPVIGIVDGDLLVSPGIVEDLRASAEAAKQLLHTLRPEAKTALILPAFITKPMSLQEATRFAEEAVLFDKAELRAAYLNHSLLAFDPGKPGHRATNYERWFTSDQQYDVKYEHRYEPWVLANRRSVPWHDVLFKGYGLNKIIHIESMNASGYKFVVHPSWFFVHRAHKSTAAKRLVLVAKAAAAQGLTPEKVDPSTAYGHVQEVGERIRASMANGTYTAQVDKAVDACLQRLSWWAGTRTAGPAHRRGRGLSQAAGQRLGEGSGGGGEDPW